MGYSLEIDEQQNLITITYNENSDFKDRIDALNDVINHLKQNPTTNILIDAASAKEKLSAEQQQRFAQMLANNSAFFQSNRTAIYNPNSIHKQVTALSYVQGHTRFVEFNNKTEARQWATHQFD